MGETAGAFQKWCYKKNKPFQFFGLTDVEWTTENLVQILRILRVKPRQGMKDFLFARVQKTYGMKTLDDSTTTELRNLARSRTAELQLIRNRRQKRVREDVGRRRREQRKRETPVTGGGGEDQGEHKRRGKDEITAKREVKATRKDRRDTAAEDEVLAKGRDSDQEPQPLSPRRYCQICFVTLTTATAPCSGITSTCKHEPDFCLPCLHRNIDIQMASKLWNQITCPHSHCRSTLEYADVKKVAARSSFERYDNYVLSQALGEIDDFVKCAHEGCTFSGLADKQRENFMICAACEGKTCLGCKRIWHGELSCGKNAEKLESDQTTRIRQEAASKKYLEKKSKRCPNCGVKIIKHSGCNHMTCTACYHEFCWACLADYNQIRTHGNSQHSCDCPHHPTNLPVMGMVL